MSESVPLNEQGEIAKRFLDGFVEALGVEVTSTISFLDDETVEVSIDATPPTQLGILVGPRGVTLQALQEVTRTYVQSKVEGRTDRILVDVAKYRERRVAALGRFASQVADEVLESGEERALEPMSPADRKAVHDALSGREDVVTRSEGEEPRRFVVISLA
jgi:spoIIIJ-associated protein